MAGLLARRAAGAAFTLLLVALLVHQLAGRLPAPVGGAGLSPGGDSAAAFLLRAARLDFGTSAREGRPVLDVALGRFAVSLSVALPAFLLAVLAALGAGTLSAARPGGAADRLLGRAAFLLQALPPFFLGALLLRLLSRGGAFFPLFPTGGLASQGAASLAALPRLLDAAHHAALPVLCLAAALFPALSRIVRASLISTLAEDHVVAARARGLSEPRILLQSLRASLAPALALAGPLLPLAAGHAIVLESVFALPGAGLLALDAVAARDLPVLACVTLLTALLVAASLAAADVAATLLDPRHGID